MRPNTWKRYPSIHFVWLSYLYEHGRPWLPTVCNLIHPVWTDGVSTMLGAPHPWPRHPAAPSPDSFYIFKSPNGVAFLRPSIYSISAVLDLPVAQECGSWGPVFTSVWPSWTFLWLKSAVPETQYLQVFGRPGPSCGSRMRFLGPSIYKCLAVLGIPVSQECGS